MDLAIRTAVRVFCFLGVFIVVIVTHNLQQAHRLSDSAALFWNTNGYGELIEAGPTTILFADPRREETREYTQGTVG